MAARHPARSAGILLYRCIPGATPTADTLDVLIGHMGGPFWASKEQAAWTIPKGLVGDDDSDDRAAARREFTEETGHVAPDAELVDLGVFVQSRAKEIHIWTAPGTLDPSTCVSNTFEMEWPPKSGNRQHFPEIDRFAWYPISEAEGRLVAGQRQVLDALHLATCTD